jgi:hypothetical protein
MLLPGARPNRKPLRILLDCEPMSADEDGSTRRGRSAPITGVRAKCPLPVVEQVVGSELPLLRSGCHCLLTRI